MEVLGEEFMWNLRNGFYSRSKRLFFFGRYFVPLRGQNAKFGRLNGIIKGMWILFVSCDYHNDVKSS